MPDEHSYTDTVLFHGNRKNRSRTDGYIYCYKSSSGYAMESHIHAAYEIIYITKGKCIYTVEGREYYVSPGDVIFTRPGELHSFSFPEACPYDRRFLHIYPDFIRVLPQINTEFNKDGRAAFHHISADVVIEQGIDKLFYKLDSVTDEEASLRELDVYACAFMLTAKIVGLLRQPKKLDRQSLTNSNVSKIMQYVNEHYRENINLTMISDAVYLTPGHISRLFKSQTGMALKAYINLQRIVMAKKLVGLGMPIINIPSRCGYNDYSTFYRAFVKYTGLSPEGYKKMNNDL